MRVLGLAVLTVGLLSRPAPADDRGGVPPAAAADTSAGRVLTVAPPEVAPPAGVPAARDTGAIRRAKTFDEPRWVMLRSLVIPGWGQLHNRAWIKTVLVAGGEGALLYNITRDSRDLRGLEAAVKDAQRRGDLDAENLAVDRYNARLDRFVGRQWLLGGLLVYALVDAYVDAHFVNFRFEFDHDPARPAELRIGMEKRF